ncbi:MAG: IS1634 family transposase [Planctomycetaceae bacterium]
MNQTTWYGSQTDVETATFGALAVIEPMIQKINLAGIINQHLPADPQAEFDHGAILSMLAAARLYSPVALSNVAEWAEQSGADTLWNIPADKLNDDRLGRSLDAFFTQRHSILASLALHVAAVFKVPLNRLHYDPTHILFTGAYAAAEAREDTGEGETLIDHALNPAHITKGRGTDDAPKGTRMIHAGLVTFIDELGPLPFFGHTIDGNQNGRTGIRQQLALIEKTLKIPRFTMLSDRGTFSVAHLLRLEDAKSHAICSVPWADVKDLFEEKWTSLQWQTASFLSIEQKRRRDRDSSLPQEHYELAVVKHKFHDDESGRSIDTRVIFVFSTADQKVVQQQRQKQIQRIKDELQQIELSVAAGRYNDKMTAVSKRVARAFNSGNSDRYFAWDLTKLTPAELKAATKSTVRGGRVPTHRFTWSFDESLVKDDEANDGYSAIVTTVPPATHNADTVFTMFREQNLVEHANRQFKGPLAVRPVFLHSPERVEALVFLLMISLMVYFLVQRTYRQNTPEDAPEKERRTTTATILTAFRSYAILIDHNPLGRVVNATRLTTRQREILRRLNFPSPAQTLSRRLARPPD